MLKIKNFLDLAEFVLKHKRNALNEEEIWIAAIELIQNKTIAFITNGKTPWQTIGAKLYMDMKNNPDKTKFFKLVKPKRFALKDNIMKQNIPNSVISSLSPTQNIADNLSCIESEPKTERDLHKYLVLWLAKEKEIRAKTIFHELSSKSKVKNGEIKNQWLYPDMLGVEFLFPDTDEIIKLTNNLAIPLVKLYSYELKKELTAGNVREYYFQAVSNSSWANEGYLVFEESSLEQSMLDELQRLNNAFGIGVIKLGTKGNIFETEVLFLSRVKENIDLETLNHLATKNPNVKTFIKVVNEIVEVKNSQRDQESQKLYVEAQAKNFDKIDESLIDFEE